MMKTFSCFLVLVVFLCCTLQTAGIRRVDVALVYDQQRKSSNNSNEYWNATETWIKTLLARNGSNEETQVAVVGCLSSAYRNKPKLYLNGTGAVGNNSLQKVLAARATLTNVGGKQNFAKCMEMVQSHVFVEKSRDRTDALNVLFFFSTCYFAVPVPDEIVVKMCTFLHKFLFVCSAEPNSVLNELQNISAMYTFNTPAELLKTMDDTLTYLNDPGYLCPTSCGTKRGTTIDANSSDSRRPNATGKTATDEAIQGGGGDSSSGSDITSFIIGGLAVVVVLSIIVVILVVMIVRRKNGKREMKKLQTKQTKHPIGPKVDLLKKQPHQKILDKVTWNEKERYVKVCVNKSPPRKEVSKSKTTSDTVTRTVSSE